MIIPINPESETHLTRVTHTIESTVSQNRSCGTRDKGRNGCNADATADTPHEIEVTR